MAYFERLKSKRDLAILKRAVGKSICEADGQTLAAFYSNVSCKTKDEEKLFYMACLYSEQKKNGITEVPKAWASLKQPNTRIAHIIDSPWDDNLARTLIRLVRMLRRKGYSIDIEQLTKDVIFWGSDITRRKWIKLITKTEEC